MNKKTDEVLGKILNAFETGNIPEALTIVTLPNLDVPCSKWSLSNRLLCFIEGTSDARGFRQWKGVSRYPKKGSKAFFILTPRLKKIKDKKSEEEKIALTGFQAVPVFRYEDTDGEKIELPDLNPPALPALYGVAQSWEIEVNWQGFQGNAYGSYSPGRKTITLATHEEEVFFHELGHAAHHRIKGRIEKGQDWKQEITAELTASVLAHLYGKRTNIGGNFRYIKHYAEEARMDAYKSCLSVIADVEKCLGLIIGKEVIRKTGI